MNLNLPQGITEAEFRDLMDYCRNILLPHPGYKLWVRFIAAIIGPRHDGLVDRHFPKDEVDYERGYIAGMEEVFSMPARLAEQFDKLGTDDETQEPSSKA